MQIYLKLGIALLFLLTAPSDKANAGNHSQNTSGGDRLQLTLQQTVDQAVEHSPHIISAAKDVEIAGERIKEITAAGIPQVNGSVGYQYYFEIPTSLVPAEFFGGEPGEFEEIRFGTEQTLNASVNVNQMLFDGSYIAGLRAARTYSRLADQNLERTELEVRNTVTETYFIALLGRDNLSIVRQNLANMKKILSETEKTVKTGFTDPINIDQIELSVSNMQNRLLNMERQYELTLNLLKYQTGIDMDTEIELSDTLGHLFGRMMVEALEGEEFRYQDHIDYRIMISRENLEHKYLKRERSLYLPRLNAMYTYQQMAMRNNFNFTDPEKPWFPSSFVSVSLSIPIFSGGMRSARVQQARLEVSKAETATRQVGESLKLQISEARAQFKTAMEKYISEKDNLKLAERILERTTTMHREGMAGSLELTQANDQLLATRGNYYSAMFEFVKAKNNLEKARGTRR